jgi:hypothetical protein
MQEFVNELNELLLKYKIPIDEAVRIYQSSNNIKHKNRLTQCYEDNGNIWCYYSEENNPCGCGSNCYHYEYDKMNNKIYGVCNACGTDIYEMKEEYMNEELNIGQWLGR